MTSYITSYKFCKIIPTCTKNRHIIKKQKQTKIKSQKMHSFKKSKLTNVQTKKKTFRKRKKY